MGYDSQASWLFGPGVGGLSNAGTLAMFKRGLPLDAQVIYGGSQAYANYSYGVFMSAAGYPLNFALWGASFGKCSPQLPSTLPITSTFFSFDAANAPTDIQSDGLDGDTYYNGMDSVSTYLTWQRIQQPGIRRLAIRCTEFFSAKGQYKL